MAAAKKASPAPKAKANGKDKAMKAGLAGAAIGAGATAMNPYAAGNSEDEETMDFESMSETMESDDAAATTRRRRPHRNRD